MEAEAGPRDPGFAALTFLMTFPPNQTAIKRNNPRKFLRSVGDGETVEFDVVEGEKFTKHFHVCFLHGTPALTGPSVSPLE